MAYSASMRLIWLARGLGVSGLSAACAVMAHEGPGGLAGGRPLIAALAGAGAAALGVGVFLGAAVSRYARAARVRRGDLLAARLDLEAAPGMSALVATMLVCQATAHAGLLVFGVAAHGGPPAPLAVHMLLALLAAAVLIAFERLLRAAGGALADAIATAAGTLAVRPAASPRGIARLRPAPRDRAHRGRAPPCVAGHCI